MTLKPYEQPPLIKEWIQHPIPVCCFTCKHFKNPFCEYFNGVVPENFASERLKCSQWSDSFLDIPF